MNLQSHSNNEISGANNQEEQNKNNLEFLSNKKSKDLRIIFLILAIILTLLIIFKIYVSIAQINHSFSKIKEINDLFSNKESRGLQTCNNIRGFLEYSKMNQFRINFNYFLSIISLIFLSIQKKNEINKYFRGGLILSFLSSTIFSIFFDMSKLSSPNFGYYFISFLFASLVFYMLYNRIRTLTNFLIGLLSFYAFYWFIFVFFGTEIEKLVLRSGLKTFSESYRTDEKIFDPIEKKCKKYDFDIGNVFVYNSKTRIHGIEKFQVILQQDVFNSIIAIKYPVIEKLDRLRPLAVSFVAAFIIKAFNNLQLYPFMGKFIISLAHFILGSVFIYFFEETMPFHELAAVFFFLQYVFNEYLGELTFNIIYKRIFSSVLEEMIKSPQESNYIFDDMLRLIILNPIIYSPTRLFKMFSSYPSMDIACNKALEAIRKL